MTPRRVLVLGGTGGTGQHVIAQALQAGHTVTALVRDAARLGAVSSAVRVVKGDVTRDVQAVAAAVRNQDVVISTLGRGKSFKSGGLIAQSVPILVRALESHGPRRLIFTSAFGVGDSFAQLPLGPRIFIRLMLRDVYADKTAGETVLRGSGLDWTIVYPAGLNDGPATGVYRTGEHIPLKGFPTISRGNVAHFLLSQIDDTTYMRKAVLIAT